MKELMIGNAAVARGMYEAGCEVVSSYPGTPSTEITEFAAGYDDIYCEWAPNEKVALETAYGASLNGVRAACAMKHVGLNVAADPLFTLSYTGVNGGLLVCVADDPGMHSSQNEQDSRHYAVSAKLPMLEPADSEECKKFAKLAFELSEQFDVPCMLRVCTRIAHSQSIVDTADREPRERKPYVKDPAKNLMSPAFAIAKHPIVEERLKRLTEYAETSDVNRIEPGDTKIGIITSGACYQYCKEVFGEGASILKLGMVNPLPVKLIREFAEKADKLYVVEELDGVIEAHCRNIGVEVVGKEMFTPLGEYSQKSIAAAFGLPEKEYVTADTAVPVRPPVMCSGCPHRGMFYVLAQNDLTVIGDIGCYTLGSAAPLNAMDCNLCMGASVSGLHGFNKAAKGGSDSKTVGVIGDSTFIHSGMTGLVNIAYNASNSTVIILDNSITGMTGHQHNPTTGYNIKGDPAAKIDLEALCHALGINRVRVVDPYELEECDKAVKEELSAEEPSVIISRRPCVLLKSVKAKPPVTVDKDKCRSCKKCMKFGCPSIHISGGKAEIDKTLCVGCGVCKQLCPFEAIGEQEV